MRNQLKCSVDERTILIQFFATFSTKCYHWNLSLPICNNFSKEICLEKPVFSNVSRLNHSSSINNTVTNKTKHFPQLFVLGPQVALRQKMYGFLS